MDYLKNRAKSGDVAVLELTFRNVSLGKWSKNMILLPAFNLVDLPKRANKKGKKEFAVASGLPDYCSPHVCVPDVVD